MVLNLILRAPELVRTKAYMEEACQLVLQRVSHRWIDFAPLLPAHIHERNQYEYLTQPLRFVEA